MHGHSFIIDVMDPCVLSHTVESSELVEPEGHF